MSFTFTNLDFEVVFFLPIYVRKWANYDEGLLGRQMIKVLAWPTNNASQFYGQRTGGQFKCEHFTKFCASLHEIFGFHGFNLSSFVVCLNMAGLILFW